ncbi:formate-dependent nitrite reductase complex subunit NrfF [Burkholderiaceae bacterium]
MSYVFSITHALVSAALAVCAITASAQTVSSPMPVPATGQVREAAPMADDPKLEARLVDISQELRCLVCQNESLAASNAELAQDLRREVRDLIRQGNTDQEVKDFLVARYGDFVLYRPEVKPLTWVLWFGPFVLLLVAAVLMGVYLRQRRQQVQPAPLSEADRARAQKILKA